jgi:hypothetical protein
MVPIQLQIQNKINLEIALMNTHQEQIIARISRSMKNLEDRALITRLITALDKKYDMAAKVTKEPGVEDIILQLVGRIESAYGSLSAVGGKRILDLACGSNTSQEPPLINLRIPFSGRKMRIGRSKGFTAKFEPWFCRILLELKADPVGIDIGDLEGEAFERYKVDLGLKGALDILPSQSFDGIQDSRLFGSPEFTAQFQDQEARLQVAREIRRQEQRILKEGGLLIHSDAEYLLRAR